MIDIAVVAIVVVLPGPREDARLCDRARALHRVVGWQLKGGFYKS